MNANVEDLRVTGFMKAIKFVLSRLIGDSFEELLFQWRRASARVRTWMGRPYMAMYGMDRRLEALLGFTGGTFIEAGANDGIAQSNTYFLENKYHWRGLLVEPVPKYHDMCRRARRAQVVNCGLGPFHEDGTELEMLSGGLMSLPLAVDHALLRGRSVREHAAFGSREFGGQGPELVRTRVRALSKLLDEVGLREVDFFSLDVEGYELEVLQGLDFTRHAPRYLLVETEQLEAVAAMLGARYRLIEPLSHHDYLFERVSA